MRNLPSMMAMSLASQLSANPETTLLVSCLPSSACPGNHMEELAGLGNLVKTAHVLDPRHNLMDDQQRGDPTNAAAI
jgi:hypothetical protein